MSNYEYVPDYNEIYQDYKQSSKLPPYIRELLNSGIINSAKHLNSTKTFITLSFRTFTIPDEKYWVECNLPHQNSNHYEIRHNSNFINSNVSLRYTIQTLVYGYIIVDNKTLNIHKAVINSTFKADTIYNSNPQILLQSDNINLKDILKPTHFLFLSCISFHSRFYKIALSDTLSYDLKSKILTSYNITTAVDYHLVDTKIKELYIDYRKK